MADAAPDVPRPSAKEYLELERDASCKREFVDGIVYAKAGATRRHNLIADEIHLDGLQLSIPVAQSYARVTFWGG